MGKRSGLAALELRVLRTIRKFDMLRRGEHVLIAASGGADSMALLLCLHDLVARMNLKLTVAHLNHGLRGAEANEDEEFVRQASADLGLDFLSESADIKAMAAAAGKNLEEAAREARYAFLERAAARAGADKIATGHNLNDQAETVLFRLLRGSGPGGLEGIRPVIRRRIIRPMLECSRSQILQYLSGRNAGYREDSSNLDLRFRRNRIRHELIPYLEKHFNPRLAATLTREAALARAAHEFLEQQAFPEYERLRILLPDGVTLPAERLIELAPALRTQVARRALREVLGSPRGIETVHIEAILRLCQAGQSGRRIELPGGVGAQRNLEQLELRRGQSSVEVSFQYPLTWPGCCRVPEAGIELVASIHEEGTPCEWVGVEPASCALLNPDALPPILVIRSRLPGDRYGGAGHRKIKKMLLASRIPLPARAALPMVVAGDRVVWIPGFKPAKSFRANPGSGRSVVMEARRIGRQTK
jgi:tRNA(Ile)-lysidine synthase